MAHINYMQEGKAPVGAHLAVLTGMDGELGLWTALPPGSMFAVVLDPSDSQKGIIPLILKKVTRNYIDFQCCASPDCPKRIHRYRVRYEGKHRGETRMMASEGEG